MRSTRDAKETDFLYVAIDLNSCQSDISFFLSIRCQIERHLCKENMIDQPFGDP